MAADDEQKIKRLTPLDKALSAIKGLSQPVTPRAVDPPEAAGRVLAEDVTAVSKMPAHAVALRDGWAVRADDLADAGGYAPVRLARLPARVETGDAMPDSTDAVAPVDAIVVRGGVAEAIDATTAGDGVSPAGAELDPSRPLRKAGERVHAIDVAVFAAADIAQVKVRVPRLLIVAAREDVRLLPAVQFITRDCAARGGEAVPRNGVELDDVVRADDCDAVIIVGGSGSGQRDSSVQTLARRGTVVTHGVGIAPGETAGYGYVGTRPILIVPGRLDGALAAWLTLGRHLLAQLAGDREAERAVSLPLARKVTSTVGLAAVVPVRHDNTGAVPLASKNLPLWALGHANGWLLVPPESEGFPAGAEVAIYDWP